MSARKSPAMPGFSYAQAARGMASAPAAMQPDVKDVPPTTAEGKPGTVVQNASAINPVAQVNIDQNGIKKQSNKTVPPEASVDPSESEQGIHTDESATQDSKAFVRNSSGKSGNLTDPRDPQDPISITASASGQRSDTNATNGNSDSAAHLQSSVSSASDREVESKDESKAKETDEDWEQVSVPSIPAEKELKAAPLPTINIWQKRKEEQEAKMKSITPPKTDPLTATSGREVQHLTNGPIGRNGGRPHGLGIVEDVVDLKDRKKLSDSSKAGQDSRKPSRSTRSTHVAGDALDTRAPPPVDDASMWPTPEDAIVEEKKSFAPEKEEKREEPETKSPTIKAHAKERWVKVEHVPTVKWEFYTPPTGSRRGGRPARGGRESGGRGGHTGSSGNGQERSDKPGTMGSSSTSRPQRTEDRGRTENSNESVGSGSVAAQTSRSSSSVTGIAEGPTGTDSAKRDDFHPESVGGKEGAGKQNAEVALVNRGEGDTVRARGNSKTTSKFNHTGPGYKVGNLDSPRASGYHSDTHAHPKVHGAERRSMPPDLFGQGEVFAGERSEQKPRNYGRDKKESLKDGGMTWRDRENQGDRPDRRDSRPERGRGSYRGRGNHNNYGSHNPPNQSWSTPLPQHPFPSKSHSYNERQRQSSVPFTPQLQQSSRSNPRSQSIPGGGFSNLPGFSSQPLSPTQQDFQAMYYSGIPVAPDFNLINTMKMVQAQIEYYLSIENLCKDIFLRRHMDSQGYVLFTFVTSFKRLRQLTDDTNLIRETCAQVSSLEYVRGDDGAERLRRRENWGQWILPTEERDPTAQNPGPVSVNPAMNIFDRYPQMYGQAYPVSPSQDLSLPPWMMTNANQFPAPMYNYRNDFDLSNMNSPGPPGNGASDSQIVPVSPDSNRKTQQSVLAEPKVNGISTLASANVDATHHTGSQSNGFTSTGDEAFVNGPDEHLASTSGIQERLLPPTTDPADVSTIDPAFAPPMQIGEELLKE